MLLSNALAAAGYDVSVVLFRNLLPRFLFPGGARVGERLSNLSFHPAIRVFDGMDYNNPRTWNDAARFVREARPDFAMHQWWTASAAHMHMRIKAAARAAGARIIFQMHEVADPLESASLPIRTYARWAGRRLLRDADGYIAHSAPDGELVRNTFGVPADRVSIIPLGVFDHYGDPLPREKAKVTIGVEEEKVVLFFGLIRPYKGVPVLLDAFDRLDPELAERTRLLIVGEAWEGKDELDAAIEKMRRRHKMTRVDHYIPDWDVAPYFSAADAVVLPYVRASQSGVAATAMHFGVPIVASRVGGLEESVGPLPHTRLVAPSDPDDLARALADVLQARRVPVQGAPRDQSWSGIIEKLSAGVLQRVPI